jgi:adenylate cyclase
MTFFQELKRRNVFRVGVAYALAAWVLLQIADFVLQVIDAPGWILQVFVLTAAIGLPVVLVLSWVFELTPEGLRRESEIDRSRSITPQTGRKLDRVIIVLLALTVAALLTDRFLNLERSSDEPVADLTAGETATGSAPTNAPTIAEQSVAVLPFLALSSGADDEYFADGLTEEILNALSQLPELLVTARTSAFHFKGQDQPVQEIAARLGVRHIVEGSVRRAGERLRVTAQLIRASDGFHLWSDTYDSTAADTISVQEDIAEKIALAMDLVMDEAKRETMRRSGLRDVEAFIALQKAQQLYEEAHGAGNVITTLRQANKYLDIVQQRVPDYAPSYLMHSDFYVHILMNEATGQSLGDATEQEIAGAMTLAVADYRAVVSHVRTPEARNDAELDLAFLVGDWRGMPARIERFGEQRGCSDSNWIDNVAIPFGYAAQISARLREFRTCDPLSTTNWVSDARSLFWSGDPEGALAIARQGIEAAPGEWLHLQLINDLIALGQFQAAEREISIGLENSTLARAARMMSAAAQNDPVNAEALFQEFLLDPYKSLFWELSYYAWIGDQENANRIAAKVDEHSFAGAALATTILWCNCGAPWDLAATPNFAKLIEDAGFDWPPPSPIRFPLKGW